MSIEISDIYIYVRVVRVWCPVFPVYSGSSIENNTYSILGISGMFAAVRVFKVSARMCTIKNKMAEGFLETKIFRNAHTDTRSQQ